MKIDLRPKLPVRIKKKWCKALRSGEYKQGKSQLKRGDEYCCLGVLYEVLGGKWLAGDFGDNTIAGSTAFLHYADVPGSVMAISIHHLAAMNDEGRSFKYIAYYIERYM